MATGQRRKGPGNLGVALLSGALVAGIGSLIPPAHAEQSQVLYLNQSENVEVPNASGNASPGLWGRFTGGMSSAWRKVTGRGKKNPPPIDYSKDPISVFSDSGNPDANLYTRLAELQEAGGNVRGAAEQYEKALQVDAKNLPALLGYARLEDRNGNHDRAEELYLRVIEIAPSNPTAYNDLGMCRARKGELEKAAEVLQEAVALSPARKLYRNNLASVLIDLGKPEEALEQLVAAHGEAVGRYNLGYLLADRGQAEAARDQFAAALDHDPSLAEARQWLDVLSARLAPESALAAEDPVEAPGAAAGEGDADAIEAPTPDGVESYTASRKTERLRQPASVSNVSRY